MGSNGGNRLPPTHNLPHFLSILTRNYAGKENPLEDLSKKRRKRSWEEILFARNCSQKYFFLRPSYFSIIAFEVIFKGRSVNSRRRRPVQGVKIRSGVFSPFPFCKATFFPPLSSWAIFEVGKNNLREVGGSTVREEVKFLLLFLPLKGKGFLTATAEHLSFPPVNFPMQIGKKAPFWAQRSAVQRRPIAPHSSNGTGCFLHGPCLFSLSLSLHLLLRRVKVGAPKKSNKENGDSAAAAAARRLSGARV